MSDAALKNRIFRVLCWMATRSLPALLICGISVLGGQCQAPSSSRKSSQAVEETKARFLAALTAYRAQQYDEARNTLVPLLKGNPSSFEINELLGLVYVARGEANRASPLLERAVQLQPKVTEARTALATNLLRLQRTAEAEAQFKKVVDLEPDGYDANHNLGEFYIQTHRLAEAVIFLRRAQQINPDAENNGYDFALALEKTGNFDEARREVEALIRVHETAELHSLLGEIEENSKDYLASARQYEQAAHMEPNEENIFDWGTELLLHQTFEPAVEVFKAGLAQYAQSVRLQMGLGIALYGLGKFDDGARAFLHAADMEPSDPLPLTFLGKAYDNLSANLGDQVRARLQLFLSNHPRNAAVQYYYAMCLWKLNEKERRPELSREIESLLRTAIRNDPAYADAYLQLGILQADQKKYREAISNYDVALKLDPNSAVVHYRLGQALARMGDTAQAQEELAAFERLRESQVDDVNGKTAAIQQFVYTTRNSGAAKLERPASNPGTVRKQ